MVTRVEDFEALRPYLLSVGYRLTGSFADAEDAVQDAWLRWHGHLAELAFGVPVHQPGEQRGFLGGQWGDPCCRHTPWTRQRADV